MAEEIEIKPMDPEHLANVFDRFKNGDRPTGGWVELPAVRVAELVAAHDFFRNRAEVKHSDVKTYGVTIEKCEAWLTARGWVLVSDPAIASRIWENWDVVGTNRVNIYPNSKSWPTQRASYIAVMIGLLACDAKRPAFDILEEMAAL